MYEVHALKEFKKNPELFMHYNAVFDEQMKSGVVEEVQDNPDKPPPVGKVYYVQYQ